MARAEKVFAKPTDQGLVLDIHPCTLSAKPGLYAYHDHLQCTNKVLSLDTVRRELRRVSDAKIELEELRDALRQEVIKREVIEGDKADGARKKVAKAAGKMLRIRKGKEEIEESGEAAVVEATPVRAPETSA